MWNPAELQDSDALVEARIRALDGDSIAEIMRQLDAIGTDAALGQTKARQEVIEPRAMPVAFTDPDFDDPDITRDPIRLTRFDKALARRREIETKRNALLAANEPDQRKLLVLDKALESANRAIVRAQSDLTRKREAIDAYRATPAGKEERNAKRRKRSRPNVDRKSMSADDAELSDKNLGWERTMRRRLKAKGLCEAEIEAKLIVAFEALLKKRAEKKAQAERSAGAARLLTDDELLYIAEAEAAPKEADQYLASLGAAEAAEWK